MNGFPRRGEGGSPCVKRPVGPRVNRGCVRRERTVLAFLSSKIHLPGKIHGIHGDWGLVAYPNPGFHGGGRGENEVAWGGCGGGEGVEAGRGIGDERESRQ